MRSNRHTQSGFTLIEMMVVIVIALIIAGMMTAAVNTARQQARKAKAQTATRELVDAWRAYWLAYDRWPDAVDGNDDVEADEDSLSALLEESGADNPRGLLLLELSSDKFDGDGMYVDPWKQPYHMTFETPEVTDTEVARVTVRFVNRYRKPLIDL